MAVPGITLRLLTAADNAAVRRLFAEAQAKLGAAAGGPEHGRAFEAHARAALEGDLADPYRHYAGREGARFWVAEHVGEVVAMAAVDRWDGSRAVAELKRVAVAPAHRRAGIATRLADTAERWATGQGYAAMNLRTVSTMAAAISLYRGRGYRQVAEGLLGPLCVLTFSKRLARGR